MPAVKNFTFVLFVLFTQKIIRHFCWWWPRKWLHKYAQTHTHTNTHKHKLYQSVWSPATTKTTSIAELINQNSNRLLILLLLLLSLLVMHCCYISTDPSHSQQFTFVTGDSSIYYYFTTFSLPHPPCPHGQQRSSNYGNISKHWLKFTYRW